MIGFGDAPQRAKGAAVLQESGVAKIAGTCRPCVVSKLTMEFPRWRLYIAILSAIMLAALGALFVYGLWIGARANELLTTALDLTAQKHVSKNFVQIRQEYGDRLRTLGCAPNGCSYEVSVDNRLLSALHLVPYTELTARFDLSRGGHLQLMMLELRAGRNGDRGTVVHVQTDFCYSGGCGGVSMDPWSQSSEQRLNGIVELSYRGTTLRQRRQAYALQVPCLYHLGGCKDIADLLPTVWGRNGSGKVACVIPNDRGMGQNYEEADSERGGDSDAAADEESEPSPMRPFMERSLIEKDGPREAYLYRCGR